MNLSEFETKLNEAQVDAAKVRSDHRYLRKIEKSTIDINKDTTIMIRSIKAAKEVIGKDGILKAGEEHLLMPQLVRWFLNEDSDQVT